MSINNINPNLSNRKLSEYPHMATTDGDEELVKYILSRWTNSASGLDDAKEERYDVYLSFPNAEKPNSVQISKSDLWHHYVNKLSNPALLKV